MPTKFALAKLDMAASDGAPFTFYFDGNGKVTRENGYFDKPVPNAFSLVQVQDCPYATPLCESVCYVHKLEKAEEEIHAAYRQNSVTIKKILENDVWFWSGVYTFSDWISKNCPKGFRWHNSGDIVSIEHAVFVREVCVNAPSVPFWIYTRSFPYILPLLDPLPKNLVINLSADKDNYSEAFRLHRRFRLRICYLTVAGEVPYDLPDGSVIFPSYELRGRDLPCPTDAPWWKFISKRERQMVCPPDFFGQSENLRCGPCQKCLI